MGVPDNGPRDGDFVRYIDELTARVATRTAVPAAATPAKTPATAPAGRTAPAVPPVFGPQAFPTLPPGAPGIGAMFTIALFVVGGMLLVAGIIATGLDILVALGFGLVAWAARRTVDARKLRA